MDKRINLTYNLDNNPKFLLEQYNKVEDFFKCNHKFEPFKPNFKENVINVINFMYYGIESHAPFVNYQSIGGVL